MKIIVVNILLIILFIPVSTIHAQTESPSGFGAMGLASGNAMTAFQGHYSLISNPAGILEQNFISANVDYINLYNNSGVQDLFAGVLIPTKHFGHFGVHIQRFGIDGYNFQKYAFTYGRKFSQNFNAALTFNLYQFQIDEYGNVFVPNLSLGIQTSINRRMVIGAHLLNPLPLEIGTRSTFPSTLSVGIKYNVNNLVNIYSDIEKNLYEKENLRFGVQYQIHTVLGLMIGVNTNPSTFSAGVSLDLGNIRTVASNAFHQVLGNTAGLGVLWSKEKIKKEEE